MPSDEKIIIRNEAGEKSIAEAGSDNYVIDGSTYTVDLFSDEVDLIKTEIERVIENYKRVNSIIYGNKILNDTIEGTSDNNYIKGGSGNDLLIGGQCNDTLMGESGNDTYKFSKDYIKDYDSSFSGVDTIRFTDINASEVEFAVDQTDTYNLVIKVSGSEDQLTIENYFYYNERYTLENIEFGDGEKWLLEKVLKENPTLLHTIGTEFDDELNSINLDEYKDVIKGKGGNDRLIANSGDDKIYGGEGNDVYEFSKGFGQDVINDSYAAEDSVHFTDVKSLEIEFKKDENDQDDLLIDVINSEDQIIVESWFSADYEPIETVHVSDELKISSQQIEVLIQMMSSFKEENGISWEKAIEERDERALEIIATNYSSIE